MKIIMGLVLLLSTTSAWALNPVFRFLETENHEEYIVLKVTPPENKLTLFIGRPFQMVQVDPAMIFNAPGEDQVFSIDFAEGSRKFSLSVGPNGGVFRERQSRVASPFLLLFQNVVNPSKDLIESLNLKNTAVLPVVVSAKALLPPELINRAETLTPAATDSLVTFSALDQAMIEYLTTPIESKMFVEMMVDQIANKAGRSYDEVAETGLRLEKIIESQPESLKASPAFQMKLAALIVAIGRVHGLDYEPVTTGDYIKRYFAPAALLYAASVPLLYSLKYGQHGSLTEAFLFIGSALASAGATTSVGAAFVSYLVGRGETLRRPAREIYEKIGIRYCEALLDIPLSSTNPSSSEAL